MCELETERLLLRRWRPEDREPFFTINCEPEVVRYLTPRTREQSDDMTFRIEQHFEDHGWGFWALEDKAQSKLIGLCGLSTIDWKLPFTPAVEIGWRLSTPWQGKGYAREAAERVLSFAFDDLGLDRVVSFTVPDNRNSWGLMRRLGMRQVGEFRHPNLPMDHPLSQHVLYEIKRPMT
ncbi:MULTISPECIES: GNAT family N-acetyltransferase [unclassified Sinorhizobium]|uniref:GNAT family N-acetyltransferase n=1 Tax=unclassified Sinorhizobium TaxID=2613772 RepID=UPI00352611D4